MASAFIPGWPIDMSAISLGGLEAIEALNARERAALVDRLELELLRPITPYTAPQVPLSELQAQNRTAITREDRLRNAAADAI